MRNVSHRSSSTHFRHHPISRRVLWASRPFNGRQGRYVGVAHEQGNLSVAVQTSQGQIRWIDAAEALSEIEAAIWATSGFRRAR
jgi:hypothetical protein